LLAVCTLVVVYHAYEMFTKSSAATEVAGVGGGFAVKGHSKSLPLLSMESPYAY